ncbi:MAG: DUF58 domain-containing protein [Fidelibacterota bacterium]
MIPREILAKVRQIEIYTKGLVQDLFGGEYHSVFKGRGMTFSEVREYIPGDDIRLIDWNVTARYNSPYVKIFEEERELTVYLIVDVSRSGHFGTLDQFKSEQAAEIAAVLGFSAIKNQDKVGLILFSDHVEKFVAPKKGRSHILRVVREVLFHEPQGRGTDIANVLEFLMKVAKRRSVVFLLSDYMGSGYWKELKHANRKHDMIGIRIWDPAENLLPDLGLVKLHDPETEESFWTDLNSIEQRKHLQNERESKWQKFRRECDRINFDLISISTHEDYVDPIINYFRRRIKRY